MSEIVIILGGELVRRKVIFATADQLFYSFVPSGRVGVAVSVAKNDEGVTWIRDVALDSPQAKAFLTANALTERA